MIQIYYANSTNPNSISLTPDNKQLPALYYNTPPVTVLYSWSVTAQTWMQTNYTIFIQTVLQGNGAPSTPPPNTSFPALYTDLTSGILFTWNVTTQTWI